MGVGGSNPSLSSISMTPPKAYKQHELLYNPMALSECLGYDFHLVEHGADLIASVGPAIKPIDSAKYSLGPVPLFDLSTQKNSLVLWSRGHFKTSAVVLYIINLVLAYPDIRVLLMQSTVKNTRGLLREIKSHFDGSNNLSQLARTFPRCCKDTRLGTADGFVSPARQRTHLKEWTVGVASPKSVKTGQHYDVMFADDLVNDQNFRSKEQMEKVISDFNNYTPLIEPGGYKTVTGTRYSFGDLYGHIIAKDAERREWNISVKNCWKGGVKANGVLFPQVHFTNGRSPIGFTVELLDKIQKDDPEIFSYQYLNQPVISGRQLFTEELLMKSVRLVQPENISALGPPVLFVDTAAGKRADTDNSVVLCGRQDSTGLIFACDMLAGRYSPLQLAHATIAMCLRHRPSKVLIEGTAAGRFFIEYVKVIAASKGIWVPFDEIKVNNHKDAKYLRIAAVEGVLKVGKLFFLAGFPEWERIVEQFVQFTPRMTGKDDEIDTISLMVQEYTQNGSPFLQRSPQTLTQYITRPTPVLDVVQKQFCPEEHEESCGGDFIS